MRSILNTVAVFAASNEAGSAPVTAPVAPVAPATTDTKPALAKPAKITKPATAKPVVATAKPAVKRVAKPAPAAPATADAEPATVRGLARTVHTIAANATNFGGVLSDRDHAYIAFFASFAGAKRDGTVLVRDIISSGRTPAYGGSAKPADAGVINRLRKAGVLTVNSDADAFTFTDFGRSQKSARA